MPNYTFAQLEQLVAQAGGTPSQQRTLAGIAAGVESGGDPTAQNPTSTASGLWQELTTTWLGNGGGAYAPTAKQASPLDQAIVAVRQSVNGYQPWAPDLGGAYGAGGDAGNPQAPMPGSPVYNYLQGQGAGGTSTPNPNPTGTPATGGAQEDLNLNPADGFGIPAAVAGAGGSAIASGVLGVLGTILTPLKQFLTDSFLVIFGVIFLLVGLIVLVHDSGNMGRLQSAGSNSGGSAGDEGRAQDGAGVEDAAEAAAA